MQRILNKNRHIASLGIGFIKHLLREKVSITFHYLHFWLVYLGLSLDFLFFLSKLNARWKYKYNFVPVIKVTGLLKMKTDFSFLLLKL
jgi:hypothetical protein